MSEDSSLNKKIIKLMTLTSQEQMILSHMEQFYSNPKNSKKLFKILNGKISIRLIDHLVTNYSKKNRSNIITQTKNYDIDKIIARQSNDIIQSIDDKTIQFEKQFDINQKNSMKSQSSKSKNISDKSSNNQIFNIHSSYKSQLKAWNKKYFDPFSRGDRIPFFINNICIITTIGQLNFFKWFISNRVYKFITLNYSNIEKNMNSSKQINNKKSKKTNRIVDTQSNDYIDSINRINKVDSIAKQSYNSLNYNQRYNKIKSNRYGIHSQHDSIYKSNSLNGLNSTNEFNSNSIQLGSKKQSKIEVRFD